MLLYKCIYGSVQFCFVYLYVLVAKWIIIFADGVVRFNAIKLIKTKNKIECASIFSRAENEIIDTKICTSIN